MASVEVMAGMSVKFEAPSFEESEPSSAQLSEAPAELGSSELLARSLSARELAPEVGGESEASSLAYSSSEFVVPPLPEYEPPPGFGASEVTSVADPSPSPEAPSLPSHEPFGELPQTEPAPDSLSELETPVFSAYESAAPGGVEAPDGREAPAILAPPLPSGSESPVIYETPAGFEVPALPPYEPPRGFGGADPATAGPAVPRQSWSAAPTEAVPSPARRTGTWGRALAPAEPADLEPPFSREEAPALLSTLESQSGEEGLEDFDDVLSSLEESSGETQIETTRAEESVEVRGLEVSGELDTDFDVPMLPAVSGPEEDDFAEAGFSSVARTDSIPPPALDVSPPQRTASTPAPQRTASIPVPRVEAEAPITTRTASFPALPSSEGRVLDLPIELDPSTPNQVSLLDVGAFRLLLGCAVQRANGIMRVWTAEGGFKLSYADGVITALATTLPELSYVRALSSIPNLDPIALSMADKESRGDPATMTGILVVRSILDPASGSSILRQWALAVLARLVAAPAGSSHFTPGTVRPPPLRTFDKVIEPLIDAARLGLNRETLEQRLMPYAEYGFALIRSEVARITELGPSIVEVLEQLDGSRSLRDLLNETYFDPATYARLLLSVYVGVEAEVITTTSPRHMLQAKQAREIAAEVERLSSASPAEVLGVRPGAGFAELKERVEALRERYRQAPDGELRELTEARSQLFGLFQNAIVVLAREAAAPAAPRPEYPVAASSSPLAPRGEIPQPPRAQPAEPVWAPAEPQQAPSPYSPPPPAPEPESFRAESRQRAGSARDIALRPGQAVAVRKRTVVAEVPAGQYHEESEKPAPRAAPAKPAPAAPAVVAEEQFENALALAKKGKYAQAADAIDKALATNPPQRALYRIHQEYYRALDHKSDQHAAAERAIEHIESLKTQIPSTNAKPYVFLGRLYKLTKNKEAAEEAFEKALDIDPEDPDVKAEANLLKRRERTTSEVMHEKSGIGRAFSALLGGGDGSKKKAKAPPAEKPKPAKKAPKKK
ncbi:MAG: hypothetical protein HY791_29495 [Deltaproteobacteria bacterium]|nr:hypothetical protein [Deltaproteobacteria bacterium]